MSAHWRLDGRLRERWEVKDVGSPVECQFGEMARGRSGGKTSKQILRADTNGSNEMVKLWRKNKPGSGQSTLLRYRTSDPPPIVGM